MMMRRLMHSLAQLRYRTLEFQGAVVHFVVVKDHKHHQQGVLRWLGWQDLEVPVMDDDMQGRNHANNTCE